MSTATFLIVAWEVLGAIAATMFKFAALVAAAYLVIYVMFRRFFARRKIQQHALNWRAFRHDVVYAVLNLSCSTFIGLALAWLIRYGWVSVPAGPVEWYTVGFQFLLYFVAFDAYFYWVHRFFHTPWMYKKVHKCHHRSTSPTPLTAFAFHPIEGMMFNGFVPLMMLCIDLHVLSVTIIYAYGVTNSLLIHSGHEIFPKHWYKRWWTSWYLTPTHHDFHHLSFQYNFGGFMTLWDRWMKTEHPGFLEAYDRVKAAVRQDTGDAADGVAKQKRLLGIDQETDVTCDRENHSRCEVQ